jgi:hypothetical protein
VVLVVGCLVALVAVGQQVSKLMDRNNIHNIIIIIIYLRQYLVNRGSLEMQ